MSHFSRLLAFDKLLATHHAPLSYKAFGYLLPRNAGDIFRKTSNTTQLQPGDLLFLAHPPSARIFHVMMVRASCGACVAHVPPQVASNETIMESSYDTRTLPRSTRRNARSV